MRPRSGHISAVSTEPTSTSLTRPLAKLASACFPNSRLKPAAGEILDSLGARTSSDQISLCWIRLPPSAASISSRNGMATAAISSTPIFSNSRGSAGPSILILCALARSPRMVVVRSALMPPENAISTSVAPAMMNQVLTSWLLTTSPRLSASSRRFCVGSSVFSVLSVSSAISADCALPISRAARGRRARLRYSRQRCPSWRRSPTAAAAGRAGSTAAGR